MNPTREEMRAARMDGGFTLRQVADKAGVDPSTVSHYEAGLRPSPEKFAAWRQALAALLKDRIESCDELLKIFQ